MSALGQKQTSRLVRLMSAPDPISQRCRSISLRMILRAQIATSAIDQKQPLARLEYPLWIIS
jgi:hypothetical protein